MLIFHIPKQLAIHLGLNDYYDFNHCEYNHEAYRDVKTDICSVCERDLKTFSHEDNLRFTTALSNFKVHQNPQQYEFDVAEIRHDISLRAQRKLKARRKYWQVIENHKKHVQRFQQAEVKRKELHEKLERERKSMGIVLFNDYRDIMK